MLTIRSFCLDAVALIGVGAGIVAGVGGYLGNLPEQPDHISVAAAWADPETTGSIAPQAEGVPASTSPASGDDHARAAQTDDPASRAAWVDPPHRSKRR